MLRYTGHPFIDVGVATITAFVGKRRPEDVDVTDLETVADYLKDIYCNIKEIRNQLNTIFQGSHFTQPAKTLADRLQYADLLMFAFRSDRQVIEGVNCTFFPEKPAVMYAHRQYFPLLNGAGIANFSPKAKPGIPVSGVAMLAIHAMPMGCLKCGNLLAFHQLHFQNKEFADMNVVLARQALEENRAAIQIMRLDETAKLPNHGSYIRTRYVEALLKAHQNLQRRRANLANITGYYFTNFANKADLEIVRLDSAVSDFIEIAEQDASRAWGRVVHLGWERPKGEKGIEPDQNNTASWPNRTYQALFELPQNARAFVKRLASGEDWQLVEIFLRKVLQMEKERIDAYRDLGDRLAQYMFDYEGDSLGFYYEFSRADDYGKLRRTIRSAAEKMFKAGLPESVFTFDKFILAFEHPSDGYSQWRLARDLISIRVLEQLHKKGVNTTQLPDDDRPTDEEDKE